MSTPVMEHPTMARRKRAPESPPSESQTLAPSEAERFRAYLDQLKAERDVSLHALAVVGGISPNTVNLWYRGRRPRFETLRSFVAVLGEDLNEALTAAGYERMQAAGVPNRKVQDRLNRTEMAIIDQRKATLEMFDHLLQELRDVRNMVNARDAEVVERGEVQDS